MSEQAIGVLVGTALPRAFGITKIDINVGVMHQHRVPMLADAVSDSLVAPLITHLVNRLAEMAAARTA